MTRLTTCRCKTHCTAYNPQTGQYEGQGVSIPRTTARRHLQDDARAEVLDKLTENASSRAFDDFTTPTRHPSYPYTRSTIPTITPHWFPSHSRTPYDGELFTLESEIVDRTSWSPTVKRLVFSKKPGALQEFVHPNSSEVHLSNHGPHTLDPTNHANTAYIENERRLCEMLVHLRELDPMDDAGERLEDKVMDGLRAMRKHKEQEWCRQRLSSIASYNGYAVVDSGEPFSSLSMLNLMQRDLDVYLRISPPKNPIISTVFLTVLILHLFFRVPRRATQVMIAGIRSTLLVASVDESTIQLIPSDPRTIVDRIDLDPRTTSYLQCPACYALYDYTGVPPPPEPGSVTCTYRSTPTSPPCNVPLWTERRIGGKTLPVPRRKYVHQSLKEWMGRILSQPGIEEIIDETPHRTHTGRIADIWDSSVFRNFRDKDDSPFFAKRGTEGRYAFSLGADSFHPLGNLEAKQSISSTAIYMVLLNLPESERYKYKNMYLAGVIPGPSKPSMEQINHVLVLLVKELLEFWKGVFFTSTARYTVGRFVKAVVIPLVCDMLAARQMAGLGSVTSKFFCTFCRLPIQDIENLLKHTWPERRLHEQVVWAREWRDCESERERERLFKLHGVRWSALLELPYWNPILFSVVDQMHAAFLGLYQTHCRRIWGIDLSVEGGDASALSASKSPSRPRDAILKRWLDIIRSNPDNLLEQLSAKGTAKQVLWHICFENGLRYAGSKGTLAKEIVQWVSQHLLYHYLFIMLSQVLAFSESTDTPRKHCIPWSGGSGRRSCFR